MLTLSRSERLELEHQASTGAARSDAARRAQLILLLADGHTWAEIRKRLGCSDSYIARWSKRFTAERLAGLYARHAGRERYKVTERLEKRVLTWTTHHRPADGSRHWSSRKLAAELGGTISHMTVARIWARHGIKPHRLESAPALPEPEFNASAADFIGLYLNRSQHAAVFRIVDRVPPGSPPARQPRSAAQARPGTMALCRALKGREEDPASPPVSKRATSAELAAFLASIAAHYPRAHETHVIADNPSAARTRDITKLLALHPQLHLHFTSSYAAWLGQLERILRKIELALMALSPARTAPELRRQVTRGIHRREQRHGPVKWMYLDGQINRVVRHGPATD
ncbi:IS630 family transposase [Dyella sp.]|uniref:IS630 family transposase n=1 Tax=Dyella sp. TaxID=1869338 RepID=UPI002D78A221|nr:IS630 family transposase [Dyella sp.]HET6431615.1 IS630 family transposase [Dyella sp.]